MKRNLNALADSQFDLVVIGGGIFGACAAWDAAQRGLSVALIERGDFGGATSANSFKFVHGGIRYLQHADAYRVRQSANERRVLLRIAPHLVRPLPIAVPTYGRGAKSKTFLRIGMGIYDCLTADRNRGIQDPNRKIPRGKFISRDHVLAMFPDLPSEGLSGAAVFCDGQMHNPPRLVFAIIQSGIETGVVAANYVEATGLVRDERRVIGVRARDVLSGNDLEIRGKLVLNAAGPYAERFFQQATGIPITPKGTYSRDACFVVARRLLPDTAIALQGGTVDPDAMLSRGERHLFVAPWRDYTLIGTWHVVHTDDPDSFRVSDEDLEGFIAEVNAAYPGLKLSLDDVALWNAGLVPFGDNPENAKHLRYGHRSRIIDHARTDGVENLVTLIGVRFTTGRCEAGRAIDLVFKKLRRGRSRCRTDSTPVHGGDIADFEQYVRMACATKAEGLDPAIVRSLVHNYGTTYDRVLQHTTQDETMSETVGASLTIKAQLRHAVAEEMAQTLADVVFRRTDMATGEYPGRAALRVAAETMALDLDWDEPRIVQEIDQVVARFPSRAVTRIDDDIVRSGRDGTNSSAGCTDRGTGPRARAHSELAGDSR